MEKGKLKSAKETLKASLGDVMGLKNTEQRAKEELQRAVEEHKKELNGLRKERPKSLRQRLGKQPTNSSAKSEKPLTLSLAKQRDLQKIFNDG